LKSKSRKPDATRNLLRTGNCADDAEEVASTGRVQTAAIFVFGTQAKRAVRNSAVKTAVYFHVFHVLTSNAAAPLHVLVLRHADLGVGLLSDGWDTVGVVDHRRL